MMSTPPLEIHRQLLQRGAELIGEPVRAVALAGSVEQRLRRELPLVARRGIENDDPICWFDGGPRGLSTLFGLESRRLDLEGTSFCIVDVQAPCPARGAWDLFNFWCVPQRRFRQFYRYLRRRERSAATLVPPIMPVADQKRLWDNTIGYLRRDQTRLRQFGAPLKRGVLLLGEPGNGKTMACRWLMAACQRFGLAWSTVSAAELAEGLQSGRVSSLFELDHPGIILFDDLDRRLLSGGETDGGSDRATLLTELDGVHAREGVVHVFTSNVPLDAVEPAMKRPGRIDLVLQFQRPDAELRRRFILERWNRELVASLDVARVVELTAKFSYSELDEIRRLLVLDYLETEVWDWNRIWNAFQVSRGLGADRGRIGFLTEQRRLTPEPSFALQAELR